MTSLWYLLLSAKQVKSYDLFHALLTIDDRSTSPLGGSEGVSTFRVVVLRCERKNLSCCPPLSGYDVIMSVNTECVFPESDLKFRCSRDIYQISKFPSLSY